MVKDLIITLLDADLHDRTAFDCGEPALNDYLLKTARQHLQKGITNTYVLVRREEPRKILGYFTLSFLEVDLSEIPAGYGKKLPQTHLPAAKLGRLAIDKSCQGNDYGRLLLVDAMRRVADTIRNAAGVVGLFVDAKNPIVAAFYRKFGFIPLEDNPLSLMLPHQTILATFPVNMADPGPVKQVKEGGKKGVKSLLLLEEKEDVSRFQISRNKNCRETKLSVDYNPLL